MIDSVHTPCLDCIFSIKNENTQIGCKFDRIEKYKNAGAEIIEAYDDFDNEFFIINKKICMFRRDQAWGDQYSPNEWSEIVEKQTKVRYQAIVFFHEKDSLKDLNKTIRSTLSQYNPPSILTIASSKTDISSKKMFENMGQYKGLNWRVQQFLVSDDLQSERERIDFVLDSTKHNVFAFYVVFNAGYKVPKVFSEELQDSIFTDMKHVAFASPNKDGNGMLVNFLFHRKHAGNCFNIPLEEKIKEFEEDGDLYIYKIEEICPSLKQ